MWKMANEVGLLLLSPMTVWSVSTTVLSDAQSASQKTSGIA